MDMKLLRSDKNDIKNNWIYQARLILNILHLHLEASFIVQIIGVGILPQTIVKVKYWIL